MGSEIKHVPWKIHTCISTQKTCTVSISFLSKYTNLKYRKKYIIYNYFTNFLWNVNTTMTQASAKTIIYDYGLVWYPMSKQKHYMEALMYTKALVLHTEWLKH